MPYIKQDDRKKYRKDLDRLIKTLSEQPSEVVDGHLNYCITEILHRIYPDGYLHINKAIGVLECCKIEYYRRRATPYEDTKIEQNGDVPDETR